MKGKLWLAAVCTLAMACGKDDNKSNLKVSGLGIPNVKPKVESATPSTLSSANLVADDATDPASSMKSRLFSAEGPTSLFSILDNIDDGMAAIEKRVNGEGNEVGPDEDPSQVSYFAPCLGSITGGEFVESEPKAVSLSFDFDKDGEEDLDPEFTAYLHCYDDLTAEDGSVPGPGDENPDSKYWRAFGVNGTGEDRYWYIMEGADPTNADYGAGGSAIKVSEETDEVEMWFRVGKSTGGGSGVIAHLKRRTDGIIEYTHTGKGVGYGCGQHVLISKEDNLAYFKVTTDQETNGQEGVECDEFTGDTDKEYCIDISSDNFSVNATTSACSSADLTENDFTFDSLDYMVTTYQNAVNSFNTKVPKDVGLFYTEKTPEK